MTDLLAGKWSSYWVGAWWPAPRSEPTSRVQHWSGQSSDKERAAIEFQAFTNGLGARDSGHTTEDALMRLRIGYNRLSNAAGHYRSKSKASSTVSEAVDQLHRNLKKIADRDNSTIDDLMAKKTPKRRLRPSQ